MNILRVVVESAGARYACPAVPALEDGRTPIWKCGKCGRGTVQPQLDAECLVCHAVVRDVTIRARDPVTEPWPPEVNPLHVAAMMELNRPTGEPSIFRSNDAPEVRRLLTRTEPTCYVCHRELDSLRVTWAHRDGALRSLHRACVRPTPRVHGVVVR